MRASPRLLSATLGFALVLGLALFDAPAAVAVSTSAKKSFITSLVAPAQKAQRTYGVPASVSIAQAIENTDWGTSTLAKSKNYFDTRCSATMDDDGFASLAAKQVGKPYVLGAEAAISNSSPSKFDCSELVEWLYGRSGNKITDLAAAQYNATKKVSGSPKVGDLVFLRNNPARSNGIGHVAVLTSKLANGDWRIIEAKGRAYGVVKSTLSYWKTRRYYAGLRRQSAFVLAGAEGVVLSLIRSSYQSSCVAVTSSGKTVRYRGYSSATNAFADHAALVTSDSDYKAAKAAVDDVDDYADAIAKVERSSGAAAYAKTLKSLIAKYNLTQYDVAPLTIVLASGAKSFKVTALQHLVVQAGYSTKANGSYDSATVSAVKKFQKAKKLTADGEAGPKTLSALFAELKSGSSATSRVAALHALLNGLGYATNSGTTFGSTTLASVKSFQTAARLASNGVVGADTWAKLFMAVIPSTPTVTGTARIGQTLTASAGTWGPGTVALSYQWYRGSEAISGADAATYTLQAADAGTKLKVLVTGSRAPYTRMSRYSESTDVIDKADFTATPTPKVSGTVAVGATLTASAGIWTPSATLGYQWFRGSTAIEGATKRTYTLTAADLGAGIQVSVTGNRSGYNPVTKASAVSIEVAKGKLTSATPKISGTRKVGKKLTASAGSWGPSPVTLSYRWYRGSSAISGATAKTYTLKKADKGKTVSVRVTGAKTAYATVVKKSSGVKIS